MDSNKHGSFWPSYVDVMTTLFAITLVLFAVSYSRFKVKEKQLQLLVDEYENIVNVYSTVNEIDESRLFGYDSVYVKHLMTIDIQYQPKEYQMDKLSQDDTLSHSYRPGAAEQIRSDIKTAGEIILSKITKLEMSIPERLKKNIKFLVVIEGQSSKVPFNESVWKNNYTLSYLRAQYLNEFWKANGIDLGSLPRCELIVSGSGEGGKPRVEVDTELLHSLYPNQEEYQKHWVEEEVKNQRFLVHIVPVIGNIDVTKERMENLKGAVE
jgi:hypothetical protein